jgi:hypothetical protein
MDYLSYDELNAADSHGIVLKTKFTELPDTIVELEVTVGDLRRVIELLSRDPALTKRLIDPALGPKSYFDGDGQHHYIPHPDAAKIENCFIEVLGSSGKGHVAYGFLASFVRKYLEDKAEKGNA